MLGRAFFLFACTLAGLLASIPTGTAAQTSAPVVSSSVIPVSAAMPVPEQIVSSGTRAYGRSWGSLSPQDWQRFYHYPYVYYPHNFWGNGYFRSSDSLYYRYPSEMRIPVYNKRWHNPYPHGRRYHWGHHFVLDVF